MSILRKIPKIEQVLDNMSIESLKRLESLMNSGNGATDTYTLFGGENKLNYENKDLGVWYCNIELERNKSVETGFLIWESQTKALFISYDITQCLKEYEIDLTTYTYEKINEKLSIEEFRRVLEDNINKEVVHIDTTGNVEIGKNLVVDGKVILNSKADLVDTSGNVLISDSGGGASAKIFEPRLVVNQITYDDTGYSIAIEFNSDISTEIKDYVKSLITENKSFGVQMLIKSDKYSRYQFISNGNATFNDLNEGPFNLEYIYHTYIHGLEGLSLKIDSGTLTLFLYTTESLYSDFKSLAPVVFTNNTIIRIGVVLLDTLPSSNGGLILPTTTPTSQVIPSITTSNEQQNLTVGDGLAIENGALKTTYSKRVFEPTINSVSISNDDTNKQVTFNFNVSNFEIIAYLKTLIENNKQFTETLYLKTPIYDNYQIMFNTPLSLVDVSTNVGLIYHCFNFIQNATTEMKCIIAYDEDIQGPKHIVLSIIFSSTEAYTIYKQVASALFTNDTKIKITIKTDE